MEWADSEKSALGSAAVVVSFADSVGVATQSNACRPWLLCYGLANSSYTGTHDGRCKQSDDEDCSNLWFHYGDTTERVI